MHILYVSYFECCLIFSTQSNMEEFDSESSPLSPEWSQTILTNNNDDETSIQGSSQVYMMEVVYHSSSNTID
jgi:hypothetical protein